jgi:hypothetical protein
MKLDYDTFEYKGYTLEVRIVPSRACARGPVHGHSLYRSRRRTVRSSRLCPRRRQLSRSRVRPSQGCRERPSRTRAFQTAMRGSEPGVHCRIGLRELGDIELFGTFLGTDKDRVRSMGTHCGLTDSVCAVDEGEDVPGTFAGGNGGEDGHRYGVHFRLAVCIGSFR